MGRVRGKNAHKDDGTGLRFDGKSPFTKVYADGVQTEAFKSLSASCQMLYIYMNLEAKGSRGPFQFTKATAEKCYGMTNKTLIRCVQQLEERGFIRKDSGKNVRQPNYYYLTDTWKEKEKLRRGEKVAEKIASRGGRG